MGDYDRIGKKLMKLAVGPLFADGGPSVCFSFGDGAGNCRIDGTVADSVAVEVESRALKQVRGALIDLLLHPYPKKLLLIIPVYAGNTKTAVAQGEAILGHFLDRTAFRVVCVNHEDPEQAIAAIRTAVRELGIELGAGQQPDAPDERRDGKRRAARR